MDNYPLIVWNLYKETKSGNYLKLKILLDKNISYQNQKNEAFRLYIHLFNKNQNGSFVNYIRLLLY